MNPWKEQGVQLWENLPRTYGDGPADEIIIKHNIISAPYVRGMLPIVKLVHFQKRDLPHIHGDAPSFWSLLDLIRTPAP